MSKILIVEDEPKIAALLKDYLVQENYQVNIVERGDTAVDRVRESQPALILLDIMLPGKDGMTVCREIRQFSDVPIIMLTARVDEIDRLLGLELGADDYVCKPFSPREVVARVKAILRRTSTVQENSKTYRGVRIDEERFACFANDQKVELTPVEFRILQSLLKKPGQVLSRDQLMDKVYDDHRVVSHRTIDSHVKNLRRKILDALRATGADTGNDEFVRSVYGIGYKLD